MGVFLFLLFFGGLGAVLPEPSMLRLKKVFPAHFSRAAGRRQAAVRPKTFRFGRRVF